MSHLSRLAKTLLLSTAALSLLACGGGGDIDGLPAGMTKVEKVAKTDDEVRIPYSKYTLANGLTVILHEDKSDPIVHVDVTYHVGSGREDIGKSGFAHFFEHMMFQGSENVADEQHFALITESGGTLNGSTNSDRTNYYETVPANQLEKMLWLEADRMGFFLNAVTQEKFEVQRETVKNERGQRVDNRPYGLLFERVGEAMFPEGHPYSWSTIGYLEDLDRATLDDLKRFFLRWYGPNNAVLTIGGDIDKAETLAWVEKYFGSIPTGPAVEKPEYTPVTLDADRYISLEDPAAQLPLLYMAWPTVRANHPDEAPLDVLMTIMGTGQTSLLYKNLQKPGLTVQAAANHGCRELNCSFTLFALANPAKVQSLADMETIIRDSLTEFEARGVQDDDLARVKAGIISDEIYSLESVSGKVSKLAAYETYQDNPDAIGAQIARYENVSKADVMRVYQKYVKDMPAVIMSIVPKGAKDAIAKPDTWSRYERTLPESAPASDVAWSLPTDDFDRSIIPPAGANPTIKAPDTYTAELDNGIPILGAINSETPTTTIQLRIKAGQSVEPLDKLGLAALTAGVMNEATLQSTAEDLSNRLEKLGSSIMISAGDDYATLYIRTLTKNLGETLGIAKERLTQPKFAAEDIARDQGNQLQSLKAAKKEATETASSAFDLLIYGRENSFAFPIEGTEETVEAITQEDVKAFYSAFYSPKAATITAVSDLPEAELTKALRVFGDWEGGDTAAPQLAPFPEIQGGTLYFIDQPGAPQSEIRIGKRALPYDATGEYYQASLMNYMLGGAFNSRINLNLREDKGYTYGARSGFSGQKNRGYYRASSGVKGDATKASIVEFLKEIKAYHADGITEEELAFTKSAIGQSDARRYETPRQKLSFLNRMQSYSLSPSYLDKQSAILQELDKSAVDALAKKHLNTEDMIILVVGDKATRMGPLKELGLPIVELSADGKPL